MTTEKPGRRARKKAPSRHAISNDATKKCGERGFDDVTVAEVAAAADVSVATIFNYFETKEELFFDREGEINEAQRRFILERKAGETITSVLHREFLAAIDAQLPQVMAHGAAFLRTIEGSSAPARTGAPRVGEGGGLAGRDDRRGDRSRRRRPDAADRFGDAHGDPANADGERGRRRAARGRRGIDEAEAPAGMRPRVRSARGRHARLRDEERGGARPPMMA